MQDTIRYIYNHVEELNSHGWWWIFSMFASLFSILGFFISLWVLGIAKNVDSFIHIHKRIPEFINRLSDSSTRLGNLMSGNNYDSKSNDMKIILGLCAVNCKWIIKHSKKEIKKDLQPLLEACEKQTQTKELTLEEIESIQLKIQQVIVRFQNILYDAQIMEANK